MKNKPAMKGVKIEANGDTAEILIYSSIGEHWSDESITAKAFAQELSKIKARSINVRMNSAGGNVFDAVAIHNSLKQHPANVTVTIEGASLSAATVVAMAGDKVRMAKNGFFMIHDPYTYAGGTADEFRGAAEMLDKVKSSMIETYAEATQQEPEKLAAMMTAETWMTAQEALDNGFIDEIIDAPAVAASFDPTALARYPNMPEAFRLTLAQCEQSVPTTEQPIMANDPKAASAAEIKAACPGCNAEFVLSQVEAGATIDAVNAAWSAEQVKVANAAAEQAKAEAEALKKQLAEVQASGNKPGVAPLPSNGGSGKSDLSPKAAWLAELDAYTAKYGGDRVKAAMRLGADKPELREAFVASANAV